MEKLKSWLLTYFPPERYPRIAKQIRRLTIGMLLVIIGIKIVQVLVVYFFGSALLRCN